MARHIVVEFFLAHEGSNMTHRVRNWGEALFLALRDHRWAFLSIEEVDRAVDRLSVAVFHARDLKNARAIIDATLEDHNLSDVARITVVEPDGL